MQFSITEIKTTAVVAICNVSVALKTSFDYEKVFGDLKKNLQKSAEK